MSPRRGNGFVDWNPEPVEIDADDALTPDWPRSTPSRPSLNDEADAWLAAFLENGERLSREVCEAGEAAGFSNGQLKRARQRIGVTVRRKGMPSQSVWGLSDGESIQSGHTTPVPQPVTQLDRLNPLAQQVGPVGPVSPVRPLPNAPEPTEPTGEMTNTPPTPPRLKAKTFF